MKAVQQSGTFWSAPGFGRFGISDAIRFYKVSTP
jgi:hypothetical protein